MLGCAKDLSTIITPSMSADLWTGPHAIVPTVVFFYLYYIYTYFLRFGKRINKGLIKDIKCRKGGCMALA